MKKKMAKRSRKPAAVLTSAFVHCYSWSTFFVVAKMKSWWGEKDGKKNCGSNTIAITGLISLVLMLPLVSIELNATYLIFISNFIFGSKLVDLSHTFCIYVRFISRISELRLKANQNRRDNWKTRVKWASEWKSAQVRVFPVHIFFVLLNKVSLLIVFCFDILFNLELQYNCIRWKFF